MGKYITYLIGFILVLLVITMVLTTHVVYVVNLDNGVETLSYISLNDIKLKTDIIDTSFSLAEFPVTREANSARNDIITSRRWLFAGQLNTLYAKKPVWMTCLQTEEAILELIKNQGHPVKRQLQHDLMLGLAAAIRTSMKQGDSNPVYAYYKETVSKLNDNTNIIP